MWITNFPSVFKLGGLKPDLDDNFQLAKITVALQENDWERVGGEELTPAEYQEA